MNLNGVVLIALCCAVFMLGVTWGYVLILTFSDSLRRKPRHDDPTEFVRCGDIAITYDGTPLICKRLRGHEAPHTSEDGDTWAPIPVGWRP